MYPLRFQSSEPENSGKAMVAGKQGSMMLHSWYSVGHPLVGTTGLWWGKGKLIGVMVSKMLV